MSASASEFDDCVSFFKDTTPPANFEQQKQELEAFVKIHSSIEKKIVLVTSGGTTVPLESRTVRFIDNFSSGTRGSSSAEYFLQKGYVVIFLHRHHSQRPFHRHVQHNILDDLQLVPSAGNREPSIVVKTDKSSQLVTVLNGYARCKDRLLLVFFTSLGDYLYLLRAACNILHQLNGRAMLYLAAAVSDFYIPADRMPEHKIQSASGALKLSLELTPKMLKPLVKHWAPEAFVVSFKLETDESILISKAQTALEQYQHKVVVGNVLESRKTKVVVITHGADPEDIFLTQDEISQGKEIEEKIVDRLASLHDSFYKS